MVWAGSPAGSMRPASTPWSRRMPRASTSSRACSTAGSSAWPSTTTEALGHHAHDIHAGAERVGQARRHLQGAVAGLVPVVGHQDLLHPALPPDDPAVPAMSSSSVPRPMGASWQAARDGHRSDLSRRSGRRSRRVIHPETVGWVMAVPRPTGDSRQRRARWAQRREAASRSYRDAALGSGGWRSPAPPDGSPRRGRAPVDRGRPVKEPSASERHDREGARRCLAMAGWPSSTGRSAQRGPRSSGTGGGSLWPAPWCPSARHGAGDRAKLIPMRLELTHRGAYAIRAVLTLARADGVEVVPARTIARHMDIPVRFLPQVLGDLSRAGIVEARLGRAGGYRLARDPVGISVLDIIEATEGDARRQTCVLTGLRCGESEPLRRPRRLRRGTGRHPGAPGADDRRRRPAVGRGRGDPGRCGGHGPERLTRAGPGAGTAGP